MRNTLTLLILLIFYQQVESQPTCYFEHYSTDDGLPQCVVTDIMQDHKGFLWFTTWDGFAQFDGKKFRSIKFHNNEKYQINSSRYEHIFEDKFGFIWLISYDDEAHRFDPRTEKVTGLRSLPQFRDRTFKTSKININPSGKVWLLSTNQGCVCVCDSEFNVMEYSIEKKNMYGTRVYKVFEDNQMNSWILSNNGLYLVQKNKKEPSGYFYQNQTGSNNQHFFSYVEFEKEIWFGSGNGRIWKYDKKARRFNILNTGLGSNISGFQKISNQKVIITSSGDGLLIYHLNDNHHEIINTTVSDVLKNNKVRGLFFDKSGQYWFETDDPGIYKYNTVTGKIRHFQIATEDAGINIFPSSSKITEDTEGRLWIHPRGGGFSYYNPIRDELEPFYNDESSPDWRFSNILHSLLSDKQGNLWFCTRSHGLEKVNFNINHFSTRLISEKTHSSVANDVRSVMQDQHERIWIATKEGRIAIFNKFYQYLGDFSIDGKIAKNKTFRKMVYSMMEDDEGNIWLGTKTDGLFRAKKTSDPFRYEMKQFINDEKDIYSLSENVIYSIFQDSRKHIWIGTFGGGLNLLREKDGNFEFINHRNELNKYPLSNGERIRIISENNAGKICVGTTTGLIMFTSDFKNSGDITFRHYSGKPEDHESLANNNIMDICNTKKGETYIATFGGGLNKITATDNNGYPLKFKSFTRDDGLPEDACLSVVEDQNGNLWISTENNLTRFNPGDQKFKTFADIKKHISNKNFSEGSTYELSNNDLLFGLSGGFLFFSPDKIKDNNYKPYIAFTALKINNQNVVVGGPDSPLKTHIDDVKELKLQHKQNSFSIEYAALDYYFSNNILYACKLDGFEKDWQYVQKQSFVNYTNIPKGHYTFRVKSTNSDGIWIGNERQLEIEVLPSFWESAWAIIIYVLLIIALFWISLRLLFIFYRLKKDVDIEKQLSEMKLGFFTDISHEIRTPLTMISGPVEYLMADKKLSESTRFHLNLIAENTGRMLRLVNQILDLRKTQQIKLKLQETELGVFVEKAVAGFQGLANKHHIDFTYINEIGTEKIWVDRNSLEIMLMNLLSNAFKYTSDFKQIAIKTSEKDSFLVVEVKDSGNGISRENQQKLFTRFASFNVDKSKPSTGLGLSIVKDLITKHGGKITVESETGRGSTFTLHFLKGLNHFGDDVEFQDENDKNSKPDYPKNVSDKLTAIDSIQKQTILLVEDDNDLRSFIKTTLMEDFCILEAENGTSGIQMALSSNPDIIISDIMMPETDGIELLQKVKDDLRTSHIPVILLTAKTALENKLEGLNFGADDYVTKPFSITLLKARIENLLNLRKKLHQLYQSQFDSTSFIKIKSQPANLTNKDEMFMKKVISIIEDNMENSDFNIDELSHQNNMSRSVFYNKIKSLTGLSPIEFIKDIKMQRAAQMILSGEYLIKEISYMVGISDVKHFRESFKAKYGVSPTEYKSKSE
jgi:signal transduction histidine kinase/ligand-binding sensor domain-containing protein/DNA-binding response OmpR family regulator